MDYAALAATATRLLTEHGQIVTLRNIAPGTGNPDGTVTADATTDTSRHAAMFDFGAGATSGPGGQLIQGGDKLCLMEAGVVPNLEDRLIDAAGVEYTIVGIGSDNPAGIPCDYALHVRT